MNPINKSENNDIRHAFQASNSDIEADQEVFLHTDGTIRKRADGSTICVGSMLEKATNGGKPKSVNTVFQKIRPAYFAGAINAGVLVVPNGNMNNGNPVYAAAAATNLANAITLEPLTGAGVALVGYLRSSIVKS